MAWLSLLLGFGKKAVGTVLSDPYKAIIVVLLVVVACQYFFMYVPEHTKVLIEETKVANLQTELAKKDTIINNYKLQVGQLEANVATLQTAVATQNAAITELGKQKVQLENKLVTAKSNNAQLEKQLQNSERVIDLTPVPKDCQGAMNWLIDQGKGAGTWPTQ
jgi:septal ring factor EnvC (AmiA/AmiB activator)